MDPFIAIDPGKDVMYAAFFEENWKLVRVGAFSPVEMKSELGNRVCDVVVERMVVYPGMRQKGNPNDLLDVAYSSAYAVSDAARIIWVKPKVWKGSVPKKIMVERIRGVLSLEERALIEDSDVRGHLKHNLYDAAGIGLWHMGIL